MSTIHARFTQKENRLMIAIVVIAVSACIIAAACLLTNPATKIIPYINDGTVTWENIEQVTIYSDGYFNRNLEEPLVITEQKTVSELTELIQNTEKYKVVQDSKQLEGLSGIFIDFGNGVVVSMYSDVNYGMISDEMQMAGMSYYYLPIDFYEKVINTLEENLPETAIEALVI